MKNGFLQVLLTVAALIGPQIAVAQTAPAGDGENGKRLYLRDGCFQCHGYAGQGGRAGARIAAPALHRPDIRRYESLVTGQSARLRLSCRHARLRQIGSRSPSTSMYSSNRRPSGLGLRRAECIRQEVGTLISSV